MDRLFRHLAWANAYVFDQIANQPDASLKLTAPNDDWSVGKILEHLAASQYYANLLDNKGSTPREVPTTSAEVRALKELCARFDVRLREAAKSPVGFVEFQEEGRTIRRNRETILTQAIHHATEHRAQIAGIFANHGMKVIDLDAIDLWSFADYEGLGD